MKKFYLLAPLAILPAFLGSEQAFAYDGGSLLNQNTYGMYTSDPYDYSMDAARLYMIDKWRIFSNLGNHENGANYFIGTSGKAGPVSLVIMYENGRANNTWLNNLGSDNQTSGQDTDATANTNPYDANADTLTTVNNVSDGTSTYNTFDSDGNNDFSSTATDTTNIRLGVAYDLMKKFSLGMNIAPNNNETVNYTVDSYQTANTTYGTNDHTKFSTFTDQDSIKTKTKNKTDSMAVTFASHMRLNPTINLRAYLGINQNDNKNSTDATQSSYGLLTNTGTSAVGDDINNGLGLVDGLRNELGADLLKQRSCDVFCTFRQKSNEKRGHTR
jgi:hypothetical protein